MVETISFGMPTGKVRNAAAATVVLPDAAQREHAVEPAAGAEAAEQRGGPPAHRGERCSAVAPCPQLRQAGSGGRGDLGGRYAGLEGGIAEDAGVDDDGADTQIVQSVAGKAVLRALGVERSDEHHGAHGAKSGTSASCPPARAESCALMPGAVQAAAVRASTRGGRPVTMLVRHS